MRFLAQGQERFHGVLCKLLAAKARKDRKIELLGLVERVRAGIGMPSNVA
jgi:hypothetical protein